MRHSSSYIAGCLVAYVGLSVGAELSGGLFGLDARPPVWSAAAGLHLALALLLPVRYAAPAIASMISIHLLWAGPDLAPLVALLWVGMQTALYIAGAQLIRRALVPPLASLHTAHIFILAAVLLPVASSAVSVGLFTATDHLLMPARTWALDWFLGDATNVIILTPIAALVGWSRQSTYTRYDAPWIQWVPTSTTDRLLYIVEWGAVAVVTYLAFFTAEWVLTQYYLCFLPVVWIALRHGLPVTSLVLWVIAGSASASVHLNGPPGSFNALHLFILALGGTGLLVGMLISERNRALTVLADAATKLQTHLAAHSPSDASLHSDLKRPSASSAHLLEKSTDLLATTASQIGLLNNELQESEQQLREALSASNRMMAVLSHDLKNPLVGIRGLTEVLLSRGERPDRESRMLRLMNQSSQQALDMVDNLLMWRHLDANDLSDPLDRSWVSLDGLVTECFALHGGSAQHKEIELINRVPPTLHMYVNGRMLTIILRNLISNAIKFTRKDGTITIDAHHVNDDWALVAVRDTGVGLSPEAQTSLFASSASAEGTDGEWGTGLGLQLCQEMVTRHGGSIWVDGAENEGASFYFTVPITKQAAPPPSRDALMVSYTSQP